MQKVFFILSKGFKSRRTLQVSSYSKLLNSYENWNKSTLENNSKNMLESNIENISNTPSNPKVKIENKFDSNNWYAKLLFANDLS